MSVARSGRAPVRLIVQMPPGQPGMLKLMVLASLLKFAALIASRKEQCETRHAPLSTSSVVFTVRVVGGASSFTIVRVAGFAPLIVAPVTLLNVSLTVSFAS